MSGGGGGGTTTVQKADPWEGVQPYLRDVYSRAQKAANNTSTAPFTGNFVTPGNTQQQQGADALFTLGQGNQGSGSAVTDLGQRLIRGEGIGSNPHLTNAIEATIRPMVTSAREDLLPAIGSAAQRSGAFGGSRQAFLEARTMDDVNRTVADTASKMWNDDYNRERMIQTTIAPNLLAAGQGIDQNAINAMLQGGEATRTLSSYGDANELAKFEDDINRYWRAVNPYVTALGGVGAPGGTTSSTSSGGGGSALGGALSGAMGGASLGGMAGMAGMLAPLGLAGPGGLALGALLGAGMGLIR